ncbi:MAG: SPOR domain-containing protein [Treponema sp.]|nr:SPOR domain-containing protein [Treponema sp.]MCL2273026.1 SPOR domain-containing protein [Treponema sp.]
MEKEQRKLILVAVSVGVFLLVTITAALMLLTPKVQTQGTSFFTSAPIQPPIVSGDNNPVNPVQPVINNTQETKIIIEGIPDTPVAIDRTNGESMTIQIPRPASAAVPDTPEVPAASTVRKQTTAATTTAASKPAATTQVTTTRSAAITKTTAKTINDYWVQTGAFSAKVRAEDAKGKLDSKGFVSIIENREVEGRLWYRVRLGPYTSEKEANYWLALVKEIDGFGESQVRQTVRQQ